jgi:putrescine transport system ATP-binding protein
LARSVAKRPKVLLLDEPLGALDKKLREETQFELMDLQQELGLTFMIVTHDQEEAMTMADRIAVMDKGRIKQIATPAEIYEAPNSRFVADFIGSVNMLEGKLDKTTKSGTEIAAKAGFPIVVDWDGSGSARAGDTVWFAIRPEKMRISAKKPSAKANAVAGEVWDIAYLGDMTVYNVKLDDGSVVKASMLNAARSADEQLTWGDKAWLSFAQDAGIVLTG